MPPIPEDAVVIADYMLMADFVAQGATGAGKISKGIRTVSSSRDIFYNAGSTLTLNFPDATSIDFALDSGPNTAVKFELPFFGDGFVFRWNNHSTYAVVNTDLKISDTLVTTANFSDLVAYTPSGSYNSTTGYLTPTGGSRYNDSLSITGLGLTQQTMQAHAANNPSGNNRYRITYFDVVSPIHTSSHYQSFETPFLHELVGGDRNMEQTNLVVTPDGKTWDQVTRDVSYMGPSTTAKVAITGGHPSGVVIWDEHRGSSTVSRRFECVSKNIPYGYDRFIILETGYYNIKLHSYANAATRGDFYILHNSTSGSNQYYMSTGASGDETQYTERNIFLKRGDFIAYSADSGPTWHGTSLGYTWTELTKLS
jgi:hypothetical protein